MRLIALLTALWLVAGPSAEAAAPLANVGSRTPYAVARAELERQGLDPVRVLKRPTGRTCDVSGAACYPELMRCFGALELACDWLYRERSSGRFVIVQTNPSGNRPPSDAPRFSHAREGALNDLAGFVILAADGRSRQSFGPSEAEAYRQAHPGETRRDPLPKIRDGASYATARARMIEAGFQPASILKRPDGNGVACHVDPGFCRARPEVLDCGSPGICTHLFFRRRDGAPAIVVAWMEGTGPFVAVRWPGRAERDELKDYVIAPPARADRSAAP